VKNDIITEIFESVIKRGDMKQQKVRILSLFSGGGGLDIGFHKAGFEIVACIEIDKPSCETLELNRGKYLGKNTKIINADITELEPSSLDIGDIDFIIGGPPCQSFSAAGRRAGGVSGINDTRGSLFWYYCKFLEYFKPKGFLFENVRGILQANKAKDWEIIKTSFSELGYKLSYRILDAADYGIPQHRERVILVGSKSKEFIFPRPTHGPDSLNNTPHITAEKAFKGTQDPNEIVPPYGGKWGDLLPDIPPGMNYSFYTEKMGHPEPRFAWRSKFSGFLYKLDPKGLSKTLVAHQGRYDGPFHWKNRKLNLIELKRLQGFPDDYKFVESVVEYRKQIGNSVSPKMAFVLAKAVKNIFFNGTFKDISYLNELEKLSFDKRKGLKARQTKLKTKKELTIHNQKTFFNFEYNDFDWPSSCSSCEVFFNDYKYFKKVSLSNGILDILLKNRKEEKNTNKFEIILDFVAPINNTFNKIRCVLESNRLRDISLLWETIHCSISEYTSYDSLMPLYGHFTEPYPKFTIKFKKSMDFEDKLIHILEKVTEYKFLGKIHKFTDYPEIFHNKCSKRYDMIKELRSMGYDIRVYETNRSIPEDSFMVCYPFALPEKLGNNQWKDKGTHITKDLVVSKTDNGYVPTKVTINS